MRELRNISVIIMSLLAFVGCKGRHVGVNQNHGLRVTVHESSPGHAYVPQMATGVNFVVYAFTAVGRDYTMEGLTLFRDGDPPIDNYDFHGVRLHSNGYAFTSLRSFDELSDEAFVPFDAITVLEGETVLIVVRVDMGIGGEDRSNRICIQSPDHIVAYDNDGEDANILGDLPVCGAEMTTAGSLPLGIVRYKVADYGHTLLDQGHEDVLVTTLYLGGENRDSILTYLDFYQVVEGSPVSYHNPRLVVNGELYEPVYEPEVDGRLVRFTLLENEIEVPADATRVLELLMDFDEGMAPCTMFAFDIQEDWHITARDEQFSVFSEVIETEDSYPPTPDFVHGDEYNVELSLDNPPEQFMAAGTDDHRSFGFQFNTQTVGPIWSFELDIVLSNGATIGDLSDLKLHMWHYGWEYWEVIYIGDTQDSTCVGNRCTLLLWNSNPIEHWVDFYFCRPTKFMVTVDISPNASSGASYHMELDSSMVDAEIAIRHLVPADFTDGVLVGNEMTVQ